MPKSSTSERSTSTPTILFAGGGTGGHIFPSLAIVERLQEKNTNAHYHFLISDRPLDTAILTKHNLAHTALPACPMPTQIPWGVISLPKFANRWLRSIAVSKKIIENTNATALVAMGGYISAPALVAARKTRVTNILINLDATPGRANQLMARRATQVFSTSEKIAGQPIGLPLRRSAIGPQNPFKARQSIKLNPNRNTLLVIGGSQGAQSINHMMIQLVAIPQVQTALKNWQVLHLTGHQAINNSDATSLQNAYKNAQLPATVVPFCDQIGLAWASATIALSRAGAGSVAEAWANATPTIFLPYPHHKDLHQKQNAQQLVRLGGASMIDDLINPLTNARQIAKSLIPLINNAQRRNHMIHVMQQHPPNDGAHTVARWLAQQITSHNHTP